MPRRWPSTRAGSGDLAPGPPAPGGICGGERSRLPVPAPIALAGVWFGGLAFTLLVDAATVLLVIEWLRLCRPSDARWMLAGGTLWILLAAAGLLWLRADPATGRANLLFLMLLIWASDIGAYLAGRLIGGPRLAPLISPGKTWSGAAGGVAAALAVGWAAAWGAGGLATSEGLVRAAAVALVLCVIGQLGDLAKAGRSGGSA